MFKKTIILTLILASVAFAVPSFLTYQGILRDPTTGNLVSGNVNMTIKIYDTADIGTGIVKYEQSNSSVPVSNGAYTVQLGPISTPTTAFDGNDRWLEVAVEGTTLTPRLKINSIAYAIRAASADAVADDSISTAKIQNNAVTGGKLASNVIGSYNINTSGTITSSNTNGITANKITITSIATQGAGCVGSGTITSGPNTTVYNGNVTANSKIFLMPTTRNANTYEALAIIPGTIIDYTSFDVGFARTGYNAPFIISFNYLIIN
jgi:hypothetical protein